MQCGLVSVFGRLWAERLDCVGLCVPFRKPLSWPAGRKHFDCLQDVKKNENCTDSWLGTFKSTTKRSPKVELGGERATYL